MYDHSPVVTRACAMTVAMAVAQVVDLSVAIAVAQVVAQAVALVDLNQWPVQWSPFMYRRFKLAGQHTTTRDSNTRPRAHRGRPFIHV